MNVRRHLFLGMAIALVAAVALAPAAVAAPTCFGETATKVVPGNFGGTYEGTAGNDVIVRMVGTKEVTIKGLGGNDRICAFSETIGDTTLYGNGGRDRLLQGARGLLYGGPGGDIMRDGPTSNTLRGGDGPDKMYGGQATDTLYGEDGDDYLDVGPQGGYAFGGRGNDTCVGSPMYEKSSC